MLLFVLRQLRVSVYLEEEKCKLVNNPQTPKLKSDYPVSEKHN